MIVIPYTLTLEQPLLAGEIGNDPNSSRSLPYIPGAMVRGLLAGRYLSRTPLNDAAGDPTFRRLVLNGSVRVLNGYPLWHDPQRDLRARALPTVRSLAQGKNDQSRIYDTAHADFDRAEAESRSGELRGLSEPFFWRETLIAPEMTVAIHIERDRPKGRALGLDEQSNDQRRRGEIFRYEALAEKQRFAGVILAETTDDATLVRELLQFATIRLGRSRTAGYGAVRVELAADQSRWLEHPDALPAVSAGSTVRLCFLSDTLLEDDDGQPITQIDDTTAIRILGATAMVDLARSCTAVAIVAGFNRTWQLPLPQTPGIAMGGVVTLTLPDGLSAERVTALLNGGIGLRRAEGYGRVVLLAEPEDETFTLAGNPPQPSAVPTVSGLALHVANTLASRRVAQRIDDRIANYVRNHGVKPGAKISAAQLGGLNALVRQVQAGSKIDNLRARLDELRPRARDQFEAARMRDDTSLLDWLKHLLGSPSKIWNYLSLETDNEVNKLQLAGSRYDPREDGNLTQATALRLMNAVLADARRQSKRATQEVQA
jgi:CRISPR-associated protein Csx10